MKAMEIIKAIMERNGIKPSVLYGRLGIPSNTFANRMKQENVSVDKLNDMLRAMDYKLVIMPKSAKVGQDSYLVE